MVNLVNVNNQSSEITPQQVGEFLREHQEVEMIVPVLLGLFVTGRFQLRGANALLVNLAVASVSRQIFRQLKQPQTAETPKSDAGSAPAQPVTSDSDYANLLGEGISIIHNVPGRIRLRIEQLSSDPLFAKRLQRLLDNDDCVISARINRTVASIVINYEANHLSELDLGIKLMTILNAARNNNLNTDSTVNQN